MLTEPVLASLLGVDRVQQLAGGLQPSNLRMRTEVRNRQRFVGRFRKEQIPKRHVRRLREALQLLEGWMLLTS